VKREKTMAKIEMTDKTLIWITGLILATVIIAMLITSGKELKFKKTETQEIGIGKN
jgi:NADH:ubiquinone oxidoreductase subunit 6 (subunit J)